MPISPLLAEKITADMLPFLPYPLLASPKVDGIRGLVYEGKCWSRSGKLLPNQEVQNLLSNPLADGLDGELVVGSPCDEFTYDRSHSTIMTKFIDSAPLGGISFWVFDRHSLPIPYQERLQSLMLEADNWHPSIKLLPQTLVSSPEEVLSFEDDQLSQGFEGIILRSPSAPYKPGRSTLRQAYLLKLKRFTDDEGTIIGVKERMVNDNPPKKSPLGYTVRSSHLEGKIPAGDLGALIIRVTSGHFTGKIVDVGSGFTSAQRKEFWRANLLGRTITFKHFLPGATDAPRLPTFKGFRND